MVQFLPKRVVDDNGIVSSIPVVAGTQVEADKAGFEIWLPDDPSFG